MVANLSRRATDPANTSNTVALYVRSILVLVGLTLASIVAVLILRPTSDDSQTNQLIITIVGISAPIILALLGLITRENHLAMNSRLDQLLALSTREAHAEGVIEGTQGERKNPMVPNTAPAFTAHDEPEVVQQVEIVHTAEPLPVTVVKPPPSPRPREKSE